MKSINLENPYDNISEDIALVCDEIKELLIDKNRKYGNSALDPIRIFSKSDPTEQIRVRIDDKLSRITRGLNIELDDEDVIKDLLGYLILLRISMAKKKAPEAPEFLQEKW